MWVKHKEQAHFPHRRRARAEIDLLCQLEGPSGHPPFPQPAGASFFGEFLTSDNNLSLVLRRLDEIERKLDRMRKELRMMQELQTPTAIGYSARRGNLPRKDN